MKKFLLATTAIVLLCSPALAMTDVDCTTMWKQADADGDNALSGAEADRFAPWMGAEGKTIAADGIIDEAVFLENCRADDFTTAAFEEIAPLTNAENFTGGRAKVTVGHSTVSSMPPAPANSERT